MTEQVGGRLELIQGDITRAAVDAVVNAANPSLLGGGGVDGAIHAAAGPELLAECRTLSGCETGEAKLTRGYKLPATFVLHTVGPIWRGGSYGEDELLQSCYRSCFRLAAEHSLQSLAFPSISTGIYGFPISRAAPLALREIQAALVRAEGPGRVVVVLFSEADFTHYQAALSSAAPQEAP